MAVEEDNRGHRGHLITLALWLKVSGCCSDNGLALGCGSTSSSDNSRVLWKK